MKRGNRHGIRVGISVLFSGFLSFSFSFAQNQFELQNKDYLENCEKMARIFAQSSSPIRYQQPQFSFLIDNKWIQENCEDQSHLSAPEKIANPNIASVLWFEYPFERIQTPVLRDDFEPGRVRDYLLLKAIYGSTKENVSKNLIKVQFLNQEILFNKQFGAAAALAKVNKRISQMLNVDKELAHYLRPWLSGQQKLNGSTFDWRPVAGTNRLSAHSFGIAIDLFDSEKSAPYYWLWDYADQIVEKLRKQGKKTSRREVLAQLNESKIKDYHPKDMIRIPSALVEAFELEGFIWGGKWFHYDAMHFEYRPEFLRTNSQIFAIDGLFN